MEWIHRWEKRRLRLIPGLKLQFPALVVALILIPILAVLSGCGSEYAPQQETFFNGELFVYPVVAPIDPAPLNAPPTPAVAYRPFLQRQTDCSLRRFAFDSSGNLLSTYANYQDYLHRVSHLSTTADQFKNGCKDPGTVGVASQTAGYFGKTKTGNLIGGIISSDGVEVAVVNSSSYAIISKTDYPTVPSGSSATPNSIATADLNGDGILDMVVATSGFSAPDPGTVSVFLGNGDGTFRAPITISVPIYATGVTIDDLNNDTKLDLVVTSGSTLANSPPGVQVLLGNGDGTFQSPIAGPAGATGSNAITADFNGDGKKDVATTSGQILLGQGDGTFVFAAKNLFSAQSLAAGDFNNDGRTDIAITNLQTYTVGIFLGNGNGTFKRGKSYAAIYGLQTITATDLDGDGNTDLFVGGESGGIFGEDINTVGFFQSLLGRGNGTFVAASSYAPRSLRGFLSYDVADFNGDNVPDIVMPDGTTLSVLTGTTSGAFKSGPKTTITYNQSFTIQTLATADFNGDGNMDVVFTVSDGTISVVFGTGTGTFTGQTNYVGPGPIVQLVISDLNGDGSPDLAFIANPGNTNPPTGTALYVMLNKGNGTFGTPQLVESRAYLNSLAAEDVTGDGHIDLVAATSGNVSTNTFGGTFLYAGTGTGTFQAPVQLIASGSPFPAIVGIADMNNDGKMDVLVADTNSNQTAGTLTVLLSNGNGTFSSPITTATPIQATFPNSMAVGDINGDGKQDVVLAKCCGSTYPYLLVGNGDGTFSSTKSGIFLLGLSPANVKLKLLNSDHVPDLVVVSNQSAIDVLLSGKGLPAGIRTTTGLSASPQSASLGQTVTFTATVTASTGTTIPTGDVDFEQSGIVFGFGKLNSTGVATFATNSLATGTHYVTAVYTGDVNFASSTSSVVMVTVQ